MKTRPQVNPRVNRHKLIHAMKAGLISQRQAAAIIGVTESALCHFRKRKGL